MVRLQGTKVKKMKNLRYLGSTVQKYKVCGKELKRHVEALKQVEEGRETFGKRRMSLEVLGRRT